MPKLQVLAVRDRAADVFGRPFFSPSVGSAIRSFSDHLNGNEDSEMVKHPEDFDLFHLAVYDDELGLFENFERPKQVAIGKDTAIPRPKTSDMFPKS